MFNILDNILGETKQTKHIFNLLNGL